MMMSTKLKRTQVIESAVREYPKYDNHIKAQKHTQHTIYIVTSVSCILYIVNSQYRKHQGPSGEAVVHPNLGHRPT